MLGDDVAQIRRLRGLGLVDADLAQTQAKRVHPRQILPAVALAHRPGDERLGVHQLDVERKPRRALDQRPLHAVGVAADMRGQFGPRGDENLTLSRPPVEALKQPGLSGMRPESRSTPLLGLFHLRIRHGAMSRNASDEAILYLRYACVMLRAR
jgi:hypothetical protein